jgi:hypothetical protein
MKPRRVIIALLSVIYLLALIILWHNFLFPTKSQNATNDVTTKIKIAMGGDVITYTPILNTSKSGNDYNFNYLFNNVAPIFKNADLSIVNLE